ncbi:MAG: hypothetical protein HYX38_11730 [Rhodospirillales bacterium]|nr:hypothetical protein [Rhodospirillales bacterium]
MAIVMPLHWKIAPLEQMVVCVSEGAVTKDELMAYFKALEEAGASHYRKMLDASRGECCLTADEVAEIAAYVRSREWQGTPGPMAIFTGSSGNDEFLRAVSPLLRAGRRLRTFSTIHEARRWLDRAPLGRSC